MQAMSRVNQGTHDPSFIQSNVIVYFTRLECSFQVWKRKVKHCKWKTIKFIPRPEAEQLASELLMVTQALPGVVQHAEDLSIEINP
jgi:hypothetical protein